MRVLFLVVALFGVIATSVIAISTPFTVPTCNVMDYGAKGDGVTKDTIPIRKALLDCGQNPASVIYFPAGKYLSGPFNLTSGTTLFVCKLFIAILN